MKLSALIFSQKRLILSTAVLLSIAGVLNWLTMPRQEDPTFVTRWANVLVFFPGAEAERVERLVTNPIEEHLSEVSEVRNVNSTSRTGLAVFTIRLNDDVYETDQAWNKVEDALEQARRVLPEAASEPQMIDRSADRESVVFALTGPVDRLELLEAARRVKKNLLSIPDVAKVAFSGDPEEQILVELDDSVSRRYALDPRLLASQLANRNASLPGGTLHVGNRSMALRPESEFRTIEELESTPISLPSTKVTSLPLGDIANVRLTASEPTTQLMRHQGLPSIGVGVVPRDEIDVVALGKTVRQRIENLRPELDPIEIHEVAFQPDHVETRISSLGFSLVLGIVIVALVLILTIGPRLGLIVSSVVPLVALSSIALYGTFGGILHQISIASLVIALGLLVDNAIVVAENVQRRLDLGDTKTQAGLTTIRELFFPLATATGTTISAFVPMLLSTGSTADFTRSIPIIIILTLSISFVFALTVTPILSVLFLRPQMKKSSGPSMIERLTSRAANFTVRRPLIVLSVAGLLVITSVILGGRIQMQFFPVSDRPTVIVNLRLPEGSHIEEINGATQRLETALLEHQDVETVTSFVGRGSPRFYYNLISVDNQPNLAQIVIATTGAESNTEVIRFVRAFVSQNLPHISAVTHRLEQGPPSGAPVEIRLSGDSLESLYATAEQVVEELNKRPGARDCVHNLGTGSPTLYFEVNDFSASRFRVSRTDIALAMLGQTQGLEVAQFRGRTDPIPILIRSTEGENLPVEMLESIDISRPGIPPIPVDQVSDSQIRWNPAAIRHRDGQRVVTVSAHLNEGSTFSDIVENLEPTLNNLEFIRNGTVQLEFGGASEGSSEANSAILRTLPIGFLLLIFFLLLEFNSLRRVGIILTTIPLAVTGIIPGLLAFDQPFGFMSMLGVIALLGIVVNNAIVLLDFGEKEKRRGASLKRSLVEAVRIRTRPILLTTATTVAGLVPLLLSSGTLWPPLASALSSGLIASTFLTLFVVPALSVILFRENKTHTIKDQS